MSSIWRYNSLYLTAGIGSVSAFILEPTSTGERFFGKIQLMELKVDNCSLKPPGIQAGGQKKEWMCHESTMKQIEMLLCELLESDTHVYVSYLGVVNKKVAVHNRCVQLVAILYNHVSQLLTTAQVRAIQDNLAEVIKKLDYKGYKEEMAELIKVSKYIKPNKP